MKLCPKCNVMVNTNRKTVNIGIADVWNEHCETCGSFIDSGFKHVKNLKFDMSEGIDKCKISVIDEQVENEKDLFNYTNE